MDTNAILVIEDESDILELHRINLEAQNWRVLCAESGEAGLEILKTQKCDLIILDLMLPGIGGLELCRRIRSQESAVSVPIIMVTALSSNHDIVTGLQAGADDYITKPFSPEVLIARVKNLFRRQRRLEKRVPNILEVPRIKINIAQHKAFVDEKEVSLSPMEFSILKLLMENSGTVFSRNRIINSIKGNDYPVTERSVDVQILGIRRKLGAVGKDVETVRGIGYRLKDV